ncbi:MAG: YgiT-type zinc finger protein [Syntrophales bacterium]|nr:YgiT-type zinc finger protein [Syntrophales bacterium]MCK9527818.1 YgiT-type zinc finger protein [Syntrophales bacterium]MDX9922085.1 YgiT-type zinc finger protein [Syntrophales bacterium]
MKKKEGIITFKVDEDLMRLLRNVPNRSEFIRKALVQAFGSVCPLCGGNGMLTPSQYSHWETFSGGHSVEVCSHCNENYLVCSREH